MQREPGLARAVSLAVLTELLAARGRISQVTIGLLDLGLARRRLEVVLTRGARLVPGRTTVLAQPRKAPG